MPDRGAGIVQPILQDSDLQPPPDVVRDGCGVGLYREPARFRQLDLLKRLCQLGLFFIDLRTVYAGLFADVTDRSFQAEARLFGMVSGQKVQGDQ